MRTHAGSVAFVMTSLIGTIVLLPKGAKPKSAIPANRAIHKAGMYVSPDGKCHATLKIASMGGFLILTAGQSGNGNLKVDDVTGMAWVCGHTLV